MPTDITKLFEQAKRELIAEIKSGKVKLNEAADPSEVKEIQKLVKVANILIEKGKDKDGDKLEVVDPESTYEEPYTYDTIKMEGNKVTVTSYATMKGSKKEVDVMKVDNISDDLEGYLKGIIKGFKRAYKEAGVPLPTNSSVSEDVLIKTPDGTVNTATPDQKQKINQAKDDVDIQKAGSTLQEKKEEEDTEDVEAPEEDSQEETPADDPNANPTDGISAKLDEHIKAAIDSAAEFISAIDDKKYETALGKVIKNLTAAQSAIGAVKEHENKLSEKANLERDKSLQKYWKEFMKYIKKNVKDEALIKKLEGMYKKVVERYHDKEVPAEKMSEEVWNHFTLNEGKILKEGKDTLSKASEFIKGQNANPALKAQSGNITLTKDGEDTIIKYKNGEELPSDLKQKVELQFELSKVPGGYKLKEKTTKGKDIGGAFDKFKK